MTGQGGMSSRRSVSSPIISIVLLTLLTLVAGGCRSTASLEGTEARVDLLAAFPHAEAWGPVELLDVGTGENKLNLLDGLYFAEREPNGRTYSWSWGEETIFLLTCPALRPRTVAITCRRLDVEPLEDLRVSVELNGNLIGEFAPGTEYVDHLFETPAGAWQVGDNLLRLVYSEDVLLADVIPGCRDNRRVAVQMDAVRIFTGEARGAGPAAVSAGEGHLDLPLPADISWYVQVPEEGLLAFGCGADRTSRLRVGLTSREGRGETLFERRIPAGAETSHTIDLTAWAGQFVRLTVSADPGETGGSAGASSLRLRQPEIRVPQPPPSPVPGAVDAKQGPTPDVVVYVMDALRTANLSGYGYTRRTSPVLDRLSRGNLVFRNAFTQAPNTVPSVKSLFTGRFLPFTGFGVLPEIQPTMAEVFHGAGYATGLFTNNPNLGPKRGYHRGFGHVAREIFFRKQPVKDFARQATDAFIDWARRIPPDKPLFAYVHTIHPHNPYEAPFPFDRVYTPREEWERSVDLSTEALLEYTHGERQIDDRTLQRMRDYYDGDILYNDLEMGRLLAWLRGADRGRGTVIVFTADHGEELSDHGGLLHGYTLYDEQIHVPLVLATGAGAGAVFDENVRLIDLAPTLYELGGIRDVPPLEGESLTGFIAGGPDLAAGDRTVYSSASSANGLFTLRTGKWKYIFAPRTRHLWGMGQGLGRTRELHYLFDLENDPGEQVNLAAGDEITRKTLQARLMAWIDEQSLIDEAIGGQGEMPDLDEETRQRLRDLGYLTE